MTRVAVVSDSVADLLPEQVEQAGITVVPLTVSFGDRDYLAGVDLAPEEFWQELTREGAPFPRTAAASPGSFQQTFERLFAEGAEQIIYVGVGSKLSATVQSARVARESFAGRSIEIVDSESASMGIGLLALLAAELAGQGVSASEIAATVERRRRDLRLYVALETLEYLKRGGRISPARAAIGGLLNVKPIITVEDGAVESIGRPRTRSKARARLLELFGDVRPEQVAVLHGQAPDVGEFAEALAGQVSFPRERMSIHLVGSSVGPHVGPGAIGAVMLPSGG
ncbi:MAG TPA: DegV family protein [Candidatus Limnocylindrales bacterium]|nr:DegV family protein [Candidatus Limnocylindrales bacterium]